MTTSTPLVLTNRAAIGVIDRASGKLITWTGGAPGSYVNIYGYSSIHQNTPVAGGSTLYAYFTCSELASAGRFTIPAVVLNSLPPSASGYLYVANGTVQKFAASGLDFGLLFLSMEEGFSVPFI